MKKGGVGLGGGGGGPTAAAAQKHKTILQRLDRDVGTLVDNFGFLVSVARVNEPPVQNSQESFMMEMRAARMVQAAGALLKLVSELKQTAVFCDSTSLNNHADQRTDELNKVREDTNSILARTGEETSASLKDLDSSTSSIPPFVPDC